MKPLDLTVINSQSSYSLEYVNDSTYDFTTNQGIQYRIGFLEDESIQSCETMQFYISKLTPSHSVKDNNIKQTIITAIEDFFEQNQSVLLYMCDTSDGKQEFRSRLFLRWFNTNSMKEKYLCKNADIVVDDIPMFAGIILRRDNPHLSEVEVEFEETAKILSEK